jgi:bifunctional non-homologous end joining protein LigD
MTHRTPFDDLPANAKARLRKGPQPEWVPPMLATLTEERFSRDRWLFEIKFDGERCLVFRRDGDVSLFSRNQKQLNEKYPELVSAFEEQKVGSFIADGEIVSFDGGIASFAKLQQRMRVQHPTKELMRKVPVCFYAFDLLYFYPYDVRQVPLRYRKDLLRKALEFEDLLRFTEHREKEGEAYYRSACDQGWEGVIAKNGQSVYVSGRSRDWLKFKCTNEQEFVIGGYTDPQGGRVGFGALLVGYYDHGKLRYAGKVGTGYDNATLRRLGKQLAAMETSASPFAVDSLPRRGVIGSSRGSWHKSSSPSGRSTESCGTLAFSVCARIRSRKRSCGRNDFAERVDSPDCAVMPKKLHA